MSYWATCLKASRADAQAVKAAMVAKSAENHDDQPTPVTLSQIAAVQPKTAKTTALTRTVLSW